MKSVRAAPVSCCVTGCDTEINLNKSALFKGLSWTAI